MYSTHRRDAYVGCGNLVIHPFHEQHYGALDPVELKELEDSILTKGILTSLTLAADGVTLISGRRRLTVARKLGMTEVPVVILSGLTDELDIREAIVTSNVTRLRTTETRARDYAALLEIERLRAARRHGSQAAAGRATEVAAKQVDWSPSTAEKARETVEAIDKAVATGKPEVAAEIRKKLNNDKSVSGAHQVAAKAGLVPARRASRPSEPTKTTTPPAVSECPSGGQHEWDGEACKKCLEPKGGPPACLLTMANWNDSIDEFAKKVKALFKEIPSGSWIPGDRREAIEMALTSAINTAKLARGAMICPRCNGTGCASCHQTGFVPKQLGEMMKTKRGA